MHCIEVEKHDLNKRQTSVKLYSSLTLVHSVDSAMYTLLHSHVTQLLSLLPKANSSEITVLLLTPQHSSTNPKSQGGWSPRSAEWGITVSQRPLRAPLLGPSAGNSPVAKNNSQTDDRLNIGGDHTVNVLFFPPNFPWNGQNTGPRVSAKYRLSVKHWDD